jgi:dephospho-CoA kinase
MLLVGLTGGLGAGKSVVAQMLARKGAVVVDADDLARRAVRPGTPAHRAVVRRFGEEVLTADGTLDRARLASIVFADPAARRDLESIVHPQVHRMLAGETERYRDQPRVVVFVAPLLVETGFRGCDVVVTVSAPEDVRVARVVRDRGLTEQEARARVAAQASDREREEAADLVIRNDGTLKDLQRQVDELWRWLEERLRHG